MFNVHIYIHTYNRQTGFNIGNIDQPQILIEMIRKWGDMAPTSIDITFTLYIHCKTVVLFIYSYYIYVDRKYQINIYTGRNLCQYIIGRYSVGTYIYMRKCECLRMSMNFVYNISIKAFMIQHPQSDKVLLSSYNKVKYIQWNSPACRGFGEKWNW